MPRIFAAAVRSPSGPTVLVPVWLIRLELARLRRAGEVQTTLAEPALARLARQLRPELWPN
jgi:hypothetical protein